ncbi:MAG: adenosine kinase [Pseudomonadota bacterium]
MLDILAHVEHRFVSDLEFKVGSMNLIEQHQSSKICQNLKNTIHQSGGSVANTIAGFASLGGDGGFIGIVGDDEFGRHFIHDLETQQIKWLGRILPQTNDAHKNNDTTQTGHCLVLVTPDSERTMCTSLGCAAKLSPDDIDEDIIANAEMIYLEGYLFDSPDNKEAFKKAVYLAHKHQCKTALSFSDSFCVERHREDFIHLIDQGVDIVFANAHEGAMMAQSGHHQDIIKYMEKLAPITCLTLHDQGSVILSAQKQYQIKPYSFGKAIDTTGAGDQYAAGFLYGLKHGLDLEKSGILASKMGAKVVVQTGARLDQKQIKSIKI